MTDDPIPMYYLSVGTPYHYFGETNMGYNLMWNVSSFHMNKQEVSGENDDLGTSVTGNFMYLSPTLFYNFGDKRTSGSTGTSLKICLGAGVGYLRADGDIILTETPSRERLTVDVDAFSWAYGVSFDLRMGRLFMKLAGAGPEVNKGGHMYILNDISYTIGYSFR
jgi:hypothetical protein